MSSAARKISLVALAPPIGAHLAGWRHPDAFDDTVANMENSVWMAETAERGKFDAIFMADVNGVKHLDIPWLLAANSPTARPGGFEPTTMLGALAMKTTHLGLIGTATTTYEEPYTVARKFGSLDLISDGRAGWNIVTSGYSEDARNFSKNDHLDHDARYVRANEFVDVTVGLWDSWAPDAFVQNKQSGQYLDPTRVRELHHQGEHFNVKGPLNVAHSPQGHPVLFHAGSSGPGRELAARVADCVFYSAREMELAKAIYDDIKGRMATYGREPDHLRMIVGASVYVGRTEEEIDALSDELNALIPDELGVYQLSSLLGIDLSKYPLDQQMPLLPPTNGFQSSVEAMNAMSQSRELTLRQAIHMVIPNYGHHQFKGNPVQVADEMEEWFTCGACDGFMVLVPVVPRGLQDFVDLIVPELQRRGLFRTKYEGKTLRENMGLPTPKSVWN